MNMEVPTITASESSEHRKKVHQRLILCTTQGEAERTAGICRDRYTSARIYQRQVKVDNRVAVLYCVSVREAQ
jgi:hypothetical protein